MKRFTFLILFLQCLIGFAQTTIKTETLKMYNVSEDSKAINQSYTEHMFFGIFGIKHFVKALDVNLKGVQSVTITSDANPKIKFPVYKAIYNPDGTINTFEISEQIGKALQTKYEYKEGVISKEIIQYQGKNATVHTFYYNHDKMYIEKPDHRFEMLWLEGDVLLKKVYTDEKLGTEDRLMHNCRITRSIGQDVNKVCFNDSNFKVPLIITDYVPNVDDKTLKINLTKGESSEIRAIGDNKFAIYMQNKERFHITLDKNNRIKTFNYLGNTSRKEKPIQFTFTYTMF